MRPPAEQVVDVSISCAFTWDKPLAEMLATAWGAYYPVVKLGGPAYGTELGPFVPGRYVKHGVTFTTRGCNNRCPWCLVPDREHGLAVIEDFPPGWIVQDNNLLQAPREHLERVFTMLRAEKRAITFSGGLDCELISWPIVDLLRSVPIREVYLACDSKGALKGLREAVGKLDWLKRRQLRCYVLIAFKSETLAEARDRLEAVWETGCLPFAQLYQPADQWIEYSPEWRSLAREWSRPAAMFAQHGSGR